MLGDADKRKEYDEVRRLGPMAGGFGGGGPGGGGGNFRTADMGDLGDLFGGLSGTGAARGDPWARSAGPTWRQHCTCPSPTPCTA